MTGEFNPHVDPSVSLDVTAEDMRDAQIIAEGLGLDSYEITVDTEMGKELTITAN